MRLKFRDSFKGMDAGFRHLTIFGQHGQSSTLIRLLQEFGLSADSYPVLVLQVNNCDDFVYTLPLPSGNTNQGSVPESERPWERVMLAIESMARDWDATDVLSSIPEVVGMRKKNESLPDLVNRLVNEL